MEKKYRVTLALRNLIYVLPPAQPPGPLFEGLRIPTSALDHTVGRGAHCRVTLERIKLLVIAQSGPNKSQIPHSVLQGCFCY